VINRAALMIFSFCFLAGCAANQGAISSSGEYVEIENPAFTMSPGASPTIWVPRSYVDSGIPRGGELLEKGYESVRGKLSDGARQTVAGVPEPVTVSPVASAAPSVPAAAPASPPVAPPARPVVKAAEAPFFKSRILIIETEKNELSARFGEALKRLSAGTVLDSAQAAFVARYASLGTPAERSALAVKLQEDFGAGLVIFLSAPNGTLPGKSVNAEVREGYGGTLLRKLVEVISPYPVNDANKRDAAIMSSLRGLAAGVKELAGLAPWYGKVVSVEGERVYINAGKETGIETGRTLNLYRAGKVVEKLGFAPGTKVGIVEITGFVGTDGSFGIVRQGEKARASDLVGTE